MTQIGLPRHDQTLQAYIIVQWIGQASQVACLQSHCILHLLFAAGNNAEISAEQLEQQGVALCSRPVLDLFEGGSAFRAAIESGDVEPTCADWDTHGGSFRNLQTLQGL